MKMNEKNFFTYANRCECVMDFISQLQLVFWMECVVFFIRKKLSSSYGNIVQFLIYLLRFWKWISSEIVVNIISNPYEEIFAPQYLFVLCLKSGRNDNSTMRMGEIETNMVLTRDGDNSYVTALLCSSHLGQSVYRLVVRDANVCVQTNLNTHTTRTHVAMIDGNKRSKAHRTWRLITTTLK